MTRPCNGVCERTGIRRGSVLRPYNNGLRYCSICELYFQTNTLRCKCCNGQLRTTHFLPRREVFRY